MICRTYLLVAGLLPLISLTSLADEKEKETLFENVAKVLSERYFDDEYREKELPKLISVYRERAARATSFEAHRDVVHDFLTNIPATHLGLHSQAAHERMMGELSGQPGPSFGFELIEYDGKQYAFNVLEDGPAQVAGLRRGDRIVSIDGVLANDSPRLDWRSDDAFLPDPPVRALIGKENDTMKLRIERRPGKYSDIEIPNKSYCAWDATKASARVIERDSKRIGLIHFWLIQLRGPDALLLEKLEGDFASCDALVLDLRGRGGSGFMVAQMLDVLEGITSNWNKPIAALINEHSRSAKEVIAYDFRERDLGTLVGERTAGAVIPASVTDVGFGMHLMFPSFTLGEHTKKLEFHGVEPDISVAEVGPYSAGADPILEAGIVEAVRLADSKTWKTRRESKMAAWTKGDTKVGASRKTMHATASPTSRRVKDASLKAGKELLKGKDEAGYDSLALEVLSKMVDALGGEHTLRRHKSKTIRGTLNVGGMMDGTIETIQAAPNKLLQRMEFPGMGKMETGYNGSAGWIINPHESAKSMSTEKLAETAAAADIYAELNYKKNRRSIRHLGTKEFAGKTCHALRLTKADGSVEIRYIDVSNNLLMGYIGDVETNMGTMVMIRNVEEYKAFDGEMIATKYTEDVGGMQNITTTITEVTFAPIDAKVFEPPTAIE